MLAGSALWRAAGVVATDPRAAVFAVFAVFVVVLLIPELVFTGQVVLAAAR